MKTKIKKICVLFAVFLFFAGNFQNAGAVEYEMLGGRPANPDPSVANSKSWFIYNLNPGEVKQDALMAMNLYDTSWEALIYAADTTNSSGGGFALKQFGEPNAEVGNWVRFYPDDPPAIFAPVFEKNGKNILDLCQMSNADMQKEFPDKQIISDSDFSDLAKWCQGTDSVRATLDSKQQLLIPFVIRVPDNAEVGEHTGGILIQKVNPDSAQTAQGSAVSLTTRLGVRIYETVPGEVVKKLNLENLSVTKNFQEFDFKNWFSKDKKPEEYTVETKVQNMGNVSVEHENNIHIQDLLFGKRNTDVNRTFQALKSDELTSNYAWQSPRFGRFSFIAEIKYKDANGQEVVLNSDPVVMWIIPWREITFTLVGLLFLFAIWLGWKKYQKKKYGGLGWIPHEAEVGDDIVAIAKSFNLDWKTVAKVNNFKAPYLMEAGQTILLPPSADVKELLAQKAADSYQKIEATPMRKERSYIKKNPHDEFLSKMAKREYGPEKREINGGIDFFQRKSVWITAAIILLVAAITGAVFLVGKNKNKSVEVSQQIPAVSVGGNSSSPAPAVEDKTNNGPATAVINTLSQETLPQAGAITASAEASEAKLQDLSIEILNGGAVPGSAAKMEKILEAVGYARIGAKNAQSQDHAGIVVYYQDNSEQWAERIASALFVKYPEIKTQKADTDEEKSADVVIILGK